MRAGDRGEAVFRCFTNISTGIDENLSLCKKLNQKNAGFDRIVKREMYFTSTRYVFASLFVLSFSIQSDLYRA